MIPQIKENAFRVLGSQAASTVEETIVIVGSPRSGTTWLLELLRTLPGRKAMNEPLMYEEARHEHGFSWRTYLKPKEEAPTQKVFLETVLTGQLGISPAWHFEADTRPAQLVHHATRDQLIVKFCRLNRMLHWFCQQFDVQGPIFIVRHPCAVVSSMMRHGEWDEEDLHGEERPDQALHAHSLPSSLHDPFADVLADIETQAEVLATMWCLDHYTPLVHHADGNYPWVVVPYERMVTEGQRELRRITEALGVEMTDEMQEQLHRPSSSVRDQFHRDTQKQLSKWRRRLSDRQIDDIFRVVDEVGLSSIYTRDLEPNYEALNGKQWAHARW